MDLENASTLDLLNELKRRFNCLSKPEKRVVFIGAPGSGKGTQSFQLRRSHCVCHLATGDLLRQAVADNTDIGVQAKHQMAAGELVKDDLVLQLIEEKINSPQCRRGFILDGFPRNIQQADKLTELLRKMNHKLDAVLYFDVPDKELTRRIAGRRIHPKSGRVYHTIYKPSKVEGKDDITGEPLIQRSDDNEEVLKKRLNIFKRDTMPLINYYSRVGLLHRIDGTQPTKFVTQQLYEAIDGAAAKQVATAGNA